VGTPGDFFRACFDTGSSSTWLPSPTCQAVSCSQHKTFNSAASSTFQVLSSLELHIAHKAVLGIPSMHLPSFLLPHDTIISAEKCNES